MTVAGCVQFTEVWRVETINGQKFDVAADSLSQAITLTLAFINREESKSRYTASDLRGVVMSTLTAPLLVPTTVAALNYPDVEVDAEISREKMPVRVISREKLPIHDNQPEHPVLGTIQGTARMIAADRSNLAKRKQGEPVIDAPVDSDGIKI